MRERRTRRAISAGKPREIRPMRLPPGSRRNLVLRRRHIDDIVQPRVPRRRHARGLDHAVIDHPTAIVAERRTYSPALLPIIAITELVLTDELAMARGPELGPEGLVIPPAEHAREEGLEIHRSPEPVRQNPLGRPVMPPCPALVQAAIAPTDSAPLPLLAARNKHVLRAGDGPARWRSGPSITIYLDDLLRAGTTS